MQMVQILVPKLGITVEEVTIGEWTVAEGQQVKKGDVVVTIETDKTEAEIEAPADGVLLQDATSGEVYPVGGEIGTIVVQDGS